MRRYGQFCPVAKTAEIFCQRWTALILRDLAWGSTRFSELKRGVPMMSPSLLSLRLKELEAEGVVERRKQKGVRGYSYHLTEAGREFAPIIDAMAVWGQRWSRRELEEDEIDLDLLLWGLEHTVRADAFGRLPVVLRFEFTDQLRAKAVWWYLNDSGGCQLCIDNPGHEVALFVTATLPEMIRVYRGDVRLGDALARGTLEIEGAPKDRKAFSDWLNLSPLAAIASRRCVAAE